MTKETLGAVVASIKTDDIMKSSFTDSYTHSLKISPNDNTTLTLHLYGSDSLLTTTGSLIYESVVEGCHTYFELTSHSVAGNLKLVQAGHPIAGGNVEWFRDAVFSPIIEKYDAKSPVEIKIINKSKNLLEDYLKN